MIEIDSLIIDLSKQDKTSPASIKNVIDLAISSKNLNELSGAGYTTPEMFGAVGDGVNDDTDAFLSAVDSGYRLIVGSPGKTYILSRQITLPNDFVFNGRFCTIKRADVVLTTLSAVGTVGSNTISVVSTEGFSVGDHVVLSNSTGPNGGKRYNQISQWSSGQTTITDIGSGVITVSDAIAATEDGLITTEFPVGSNLFKVNNLFVFSGVGENISILNTIFDGNSSSNDYNYFWALQSSINAVGYNVTIDGCRFINSPCETVFLGGNSIIQNCTYENLNGSFVHIGVDGATDKEDVRIINNRGVGANMKVSATETDHSEGIITLSQGPYNTWVENNHFDGTGCSVNTCFIAPYQATADRATTEDKIVIRGNKVSNIEQLFIADLVYSANGSQLTITNNQFIECGPFLISPYEAPNRFRQGVDAQINVNIVDNLFVNTQFYLANVANLIFANNELVFTNDFVASAAVVFDGAAVMIMGFNVKCYGNLIEMPTSYVPGNLLYVGIYIKPVAMSGSGGYIRDSLGVDTQYYYSQNIDLSSNTINNAIFGIVTTQTTTTSYPSGGQFINVNIKNNNINLLSEPNGVGIIGNCGVVISGNTIVGFGGSNTIGISAIGAGSASSSTLIGSIVSNNIVMGTLTYSIILGLSSVNGYNSVVVNNIVTNGVTDVGAGGGNVVSGNITLPISGQAIPSNRLFQYPERY